MPVMSAKLSDALVKATLARDINDAFNKIFPDYLELKLNQLQQTIGGFQEKWEQTFEEFKKNIQENNLKEDAHSYEVENDFWLWEEAETLKRHYGVLAYQGRKKSVGHRCRFS